MALNLSRQYFVCDNHGSPPKLIKHIALQAKNCFFSPHRFYNTALSQVSVVCVLVLGSLIVWIYTCDLHNTVFKYTLQYVNYAATYVKHGGDTICAQVTHTQAYMMYPQTATWVQTSFFLIKFKLNLNMPFKTWAQKQKLLKQHTILSVFLEETG